MAQKQGGEKAAAQKQAKGKVNRHVREKVSTAFIARSFTLGSNQAQKVYHRSFDITSRALYDLGILLRIIGTKEQAMEVEGVVDDLLLHVDREIQEEKIRLDKLIEENGVTGEVGFSMPVQGEAQISSPRAGRYLGLICEMDALIGTMTLLWISGVLLDAQYSDGTYRWQRRLLKVAARIQNITHRAMKSAGSKSTGTRGDAAAPEAVAEETTTAVAEETTTAVAEETTTAVAEETTETAEAEFEAAAEPAEDEKKEGKATRAKKAA